MQRGETEMQIIVRIFAIDIWPTICASKLYVSFFYRAICYQECDKKRHLYGGVVVKGLQGGMSG